jgi:hypothetical protein
VEAEYPSGGHARCHGALGRRRSRLDTRPEMKSVLEVPAPSAPTHCGALARALGELAELEFRLGDWAGAYASMAASLRTARACGLREQTARALTGLAQIDAASGRSGECRAHAGEAMRLSRGGCAARAMASHAIGFLELGMGRPTAAIEWLEPVSVALAGQLDACAPAAACNLDLAEACVLRGDAAGARDALDRAQRHEHLGGGWAVTSALVRVRAMLASDEACEALFRSALAWTARARHPFEQARTELCFGERLRTANRAEEARTHLRPALATFASLNAMPWADRARRELAAI